MRSHRKAESDLGRRGRILETILIVNALDMLYFWMYQPRARSVFRDTMRVLSEEERQILMAAQQVLQRQRQISLLFVRGIVGGNFSRPLSFYLTRSKEYLETLQAGH